MEESNEGLGSGMGQKGPDKGAQGQVRARSSVLRVPEGTG